MQYANRIAQVAGEALPNIVTAPFMDLSYISVGRSHNRIGIMPDVLQ